MTSVSTAAFYDRTNGALRSLRGEAERLQGQIGSGSRLARSSDDPVAAARLRLLARQDALATVDQQTSDQAATRLEFAANAIDGMAALTTRARELATNAANATLSARDRVAIGDELAALGETLLGLANSRDPLGQTLFGGQASGPAYTATGGTVSYAGTPAATTADLGEGQQVAVSFTGPELFDFTRPDGTPSDLFTTIGTLAAALKAGDPAGGTLAQDALGALDAGLGKLTTAQTVAGTRLAWIDVLAERRTDRSEAAADQRASVGGADLALTISRLQETMTVLEATQASFAKLANLSLFDALR